MIRYFADSNIFLRYTLADHESQTQKAREYFTQAKTKDIEIVFLPEIIIEIEYVLRKVYKLSRKQIAEALISFAQIPYILVEKRSILIQALSLYSTTSIDLVDLTLFFNAQKAGGKVLSFDKDFKKIK